MILDYQVPVPCQFVAGGSYEVRVGTTHRLPQQAASLWYFLMRAIVQPMNLVLDPFAKSVCLDLADLPKAVPVRTDAKTSTISLFTSGTTGTPKRVDHILLDVLNRKRSGSPTARWLLTYAPWRWAGMSVIMHVLKSRSQLVVPDSLTVDDLIDASIRQLATHLSITPSFFRRMQLTVDLQTLSNMPIQQITFGGESATQSTLDAARRIWPNARVSHVYASTEIGDVCATSDGLEGIPYRKFAGKDCSFSEDGELLIGGVRTGDLWELRENRFYFQGRREEMINVGGAKVSPLDVERAAERIPGVLQVRAYAIESPLLGQVVGLDYCGDVAEKEMYLSLRDALPKVAWPAEINRVGQIATTDAGKTFRIRS